VSIWGELGERMSNYELGVFGGGGQNEPSLDGHVDGIGRIFIRPLVGQGLGEFGKEAQIGASGRYGSRDPHYVASDYPAIRTGQGFALWSPLYVDSRGALVHVIPSGQQEAIGGELRLRAGRFALQSEAYFMDNLTREALDGTQVTNTERQGRMKGVGWYAQLSAWPFGHPFLYGQPGLYRPVTKDLARPESRPRRGLEVLAILAGINANYSGATRNGSTPDPNTPNADITIYQVGVGIQYWHSKHVRLGLNYMFYDTPNSAPTGTSGEKNQAVVPDNLQGGGGHVLHELGARFQVSF
jgi:hypothetical protein